MVMFIDHVPRSYLEREAQHEIDYRRMLGPLADALISQGEASPGGLPSQQAPLFR